MPKRTLLVLVLAVLSCSAAGQVAGAVATLAPLGGSGVSGIVVFTQQGQTGLVNAEVSGLTPGSHGFHVHEKGDCSAPDGSSAGGHFNPTAQPHGDPKAASHHAGDMPMLVADGSGKATLRWEFGPAALGTGSNDVMGKSVVVHADPDDFKSQPAGNSGARIACGVIK